MGSCKRKDFVFEQDVAMMALLARCHVPIYSHEAAWNMMTHIHIQDARRCSSENNGSFPILTVFNV